MASNPKKKIVVVKNKKQSKPLQNNSSTKLIQNFHCSQGEQKSFFEKFIKTMKYILLYSLSFLVIFILFVSIMGNYFPKAFSFIIKHLEIFLHQIQNLSLLINDKTQDVFKNYGLSDKFSALGAFILIPLMAFLLSIGGFYIPRIGSVIGIIGLFITNILIICNLIV